MKADDTDYSSISEELARLSKENSELKGQLAIQDISVDKIVEYLKSKDVTIKYESGGYEINSLLDYFLSFAYDIQNRPSESNEETLHDFHLLQAHGLLEADSRKLSKKGNEVFSYIEVNNIDRNDFTKGYKNSSDELAKIVRGYMDRNRR